MVGTAFRTKEEAEFHNTAFLAPRRPFSTKPNHHSSDKPSLTALFNGLSAAAAAKLNNGQPINVLGAPLPITNAKQSLQSANGLRLFNTLQVLNQQRLQHFANTNFSLYIGTTPDLQELPPKNQHEKRKAFTSSLAQKLAEKYSGLSEADANVAAQLMIDAFEHHGHRMSHHKGHKPEAVKVAKAHDTHGEKPAAGLAHKHAGPAVSV